MIKQRLLFSRVYFACRIEKNALESSNHEFWSILKFETHFIDDAEDCRQGDIFLSAKWNYYEDWKILILFNAFSKNQILAWNASLIEQKIGTEFCSIPECLYVCFCIWKSNYFQKCSNI